MTFDQLRAKATAAETCLIDTVIPMVEKEIREKTVLKVLEFIKANSPPGREVTHFDREAYPKWFKQLEEHLNPPPKQ